MIDGVLIQPLKRYEDEKGKVMRMVRCDDVFFKKFGEIYFSCVNPGHIKGWKKHLVQNQHFAVVNGMLKLVLFDDRKDSPTKGDVQELEFGEPNYMLVRVPANIWYAFTAAGREPAMIANCTDIPHDPKESVQKELNDPSIP